MYLTATRPDIMFAMCVAARHQVTPKTSNLLSVKRIFKYLTASPMKSTTGGCQFLRRQLISWQCKKQTIVATSSCEAEYVAAASCYGQVLWIQNQLLDYGFNFMNTKIYIDNQRMQMKRNLYRGISSTWFIRMLENGFCCLRPILLVRMVFAGG
nr:hypothetical protein [Tanacetum cinerariifolium]